MTEILSHFMKCLITHFACNIYLFYWHFKKTGVKTLKTCCKAATDHHDKHHSVKLLRTFYHSMHLRHFFSENCFIIDLKSIVFQDVIFHVHEWKRIQTMLHHHATKHILVSKKNVLMYSWSPSCTWTLAVQFQLSGILISNCLKLFFCLPCTLQKSSLIQVFVIHVCQMLTHFL